MIKNILILIVFAMAIFLLNRYYQQSSLNFKGNSVLFEVKGKKVNLNSTDIKSNTEHFSNVNIVQNQMTIESRKSYFEVATIEGLYEFNSNMDEILNILFQGKKLQKVFSIHGVIAMQITARSGEVINLFVTDNDSKEFHLFYGLSNELFRSTILALAKTDKFGFELADTVELNKPITKWTVLNNDFSGIISSIDY